MIPVTERPRVGILNLAIRDKSALYTAYMQYIKGGALFLPTTKPYNLGDEVFMILSLLDEPNKLSVAGKVVWITPVGCHGGKSAGIGVQFSENESGVAARELIEELLAGDGRLVELPT